MTSGWISTGDYYPGIKLKNEEALVVNERSYCAGPMTSYLDLALHIIDKEVSPNIAEQCAKSMALSLGSSVTSPFQSMFDQITSDDALVSGTQHWLLNHLSEQIELPEVARLMGTSQRTLTRRFKDQLELTPKAYLQKIRIEMAQQLLRTSNLPIAEIIEQVGYSSSSAFTTLFKKISGYNPGEYRAIQHGTLRR